MRGKYNSNINILLSDFGVPKNTQAPNWIPGDNWNDLLAMSLLQGDLDHFVVALVSAEKEWKKWYDDPFSLPMPRIEMESDKSSSTINLYIRIFAFNGNLMRLFCVVNRN